MKHVVWMVMDPYIVAAQRPRPFTAVSEWKTNRGNSTGKCFRVHKDIDPGIGVYRISCASVIETNWFGRQTATSDRNLHKNALQS